MELEAVTAEEFHQIRSDSGLADMRDAFIDPGDPEGVWVEFRVEVDEIAGHWHGAWHRLGANWVTNHPSWCWDSCERYGDVRKWRLPTTAAVRLTHPTRAQHRAGLRSGDVVRLPLTEIPSYVDYQG